MEPIPAIHVAQFMKEGQLAQIVDAEDLDWWVTFAGDRVRNKIVHLDVPLMISDLGRALRIMWAVTRT